MWVYGMEPPRGVIKNTDVGMIVADVLGGLDTLNRDLYVDLDTTSLTWSVNATDVTDQYAIVEGFKFPINTDYFLNNDVRMMLPGITVYAPMTEKVYVSMQAIQMVQSLA